MAEEARGWYLSQRMFRRLKVMLKVLSRNCCSTSHSQAGVQEHTSGEGNAQNRWQLMPALNLSSAVAIAILLEPTSLSDKAEPSRCGQHSRRFKTRSCSGMSFAQLEYAAQTPRAQGALELSCLSFFTSL